VGATRNRAVRGTQGNRIVLIDDDEVAYPGWLNELPGAAQEGGHYDVRGGAEFPVPNLPWLNVPGWITHDVIGSRVGRLSKARTKWPDRVCEALSAGLLESVRFPLGGLTQKR
jgi:hypothetical protein